MQLPVSISLYHFRWTKLLISTSVTKIIKKWIEGKFCDSKNSPIYLGRQFCTMISCNHTLIYLTNAISLGGLLTIGPDGEAIEQDAKDDHGLDVRPDVY